MIELMTALYSRHTLRAFSSLTRADAGDRSQVLTEPAISCTRLSDSNAMPR